MLTADLIRTKFDQGLDYDAYVATGKPEDQQAWRTFAAGLALTPEQQALIAGFVRTVNILVISGTWCGDCVKQVPFLRLFEIANPAKVRLRLLDRDEHMDLASQVTICGGTRVPVVIFANEDFDFLALEGDRTLSRYRALAARQLGAACELPGSSTDADEVSQTLSDWLDALERAHLICRLSTKLRERHGD